jgi:hypothetical protein
MAPLKVVEGGVLEKEKEVKKKRTISRHVKGKGDGMDGWMDRARGSHGTPELVAPSLPSPLSMPATGREKGPVCQPSAAQIRADFSKTRNGAFPQLD